MTIHLGVVMDPIEGIHFHKDTSLALLNAAQSHGFELWYMEQADLYISDGRAMARMAPLTVRMDEHNWFQRGEYSEAPLAKLNVILIRQSLKTT